MSPRWNALVECVELVLFMLALSPPFNTCTQSCSRFAGAATSPARTDAAFVATAQRKKTFPSFFKGHEAPRGYLLVTDNKRNRRIDAIQKLLSRRDLATPLEREKENTREDHGSKSYKEKGLVFIPSEIHLSNATVAHQTEKSRFLPSLESLFTASRPPRRHALRQVSLSLNGGSGLECDQIEKGIVQSGVILLVGPSGSGKTTLLRLLLEHLSCSSPSVTLESGDVRINTFNSSADSVSTSLLSVTNSFDGSGNGPTILSRPTLLQEKPLSLSSPFSSCQKDNSKTTLELMQEYKNGSKMLASAFADVLLDTNKALCPSDLSSVSHRYLFDAALACMESYPSCQANEMSSLNVRAPILLLDEWFDDEHPSIAKNIVQHLDLLVQRTGALVVASTHRPDLFGSHFASKDGNSFIPQRRRVVTLCNGGVILDTF